MEGKKVLSIKYSLRKSVFILSGIGLFFALLLCMNRRVFAEDERREPTGSVITLSGSFDGSQSIRETGDGSLSPATAL